MPRRAARLALASLAAAVLLLGNGARADNNGISFIANSVKSVGRGGAEAAVGNDALTAISNPATLTEIDDMRVDASFGVLWERVRSTSRFEDKLENNYLPVPAAGIAWDPFRDEPAEDAAGPALPSRWRVGVALWQTEALMFSLSPTVAYRLTDTISIGAQLMPLFTELNLQILAHAGGSGSPSTSTPDFLPNGKVFIHYRPDGTPVNPPQPFDAGTGTQVGWDEIFSLATNTSGPATAPGPTEKIDLQGITGFGIGGQVGVFWTPLADLSFGLSYRAPGVIFNPKGKARIDLTEGVKALEANPTVGQILTAAFETYLPNRGEAGYVATYDASASDVWLPQEVRLGLAWSPLPGWLLTGDVMYMNWNHASSKILLHGTHGSNADFNEINGGSSLDYTVRIDWTDSYVIAVGTAWQVTDQLVLRCGFNHGKNPVTKDFLSGNSLGTEDHASVGAGYYFGHWELDVAYVYGLPLQIKDDAAEEASNSEQHWIFVGMGYRF